MTLSEQVMRIAAKLEVLRTKSPDHWRRLCWLVELFLRDKDLHDPE